MERDLLTKFLKLMSSKISDSDLELTILGNSLGMDLVSFAELRASQEDVFVDMVREKALEKMKKENDNILVNSDSFFAGSIDFMVSDELEGKKFFLLETNGGSHRGLSILTTKQQNFLYHGYLKAILKTAEKNERKDKKVFIIVGVPINDALIHEKVIMIEFFRRRLKAKNYSVKIFNRDNYDKGFKANIVFLIADYKQISESLSFSNNWIEYNDEKVNLLIGDGIARRFNDEIFNKQIEVNFHQIKTKIVNPIFKITDDKSLTYLASYYSRLSLKKYNLRHLVFTKAFDERELIDKLKFLINKYKKPFIIKPSGGSGGAGVIPISEYEKSVNIINLIEKSKKEFYDKFKENRNPYPYTIQEKANFSLINWRGGEHTFDIRIYLAQNNGIIIPIGGLGRIARGIYKNGANKEEFVVNLSGYDGQIEIDRGIGFSEASCKLLNLSIEDFVNMFCIGCVLFANIVKDYQKIMKFSQWEKIFD